MAHARYGSSVHLPSPGGDPDQYEEEQSGKHIAGVYIFEAGSAGWTAIEDLPVSAIANRSPCHVGRISHMRWLCAKRCMVLVMTKLLTIKNRLSSVIIGGGGWGGGAPPLRDHLWQGPPVTRNAEIDPGDNDPPPKMTQGG